MAGESAQSACISTGVSAAHFCRTASSLARSRAGASLRRVRRGQPRRVRRAVPLCLAGALTHFTSVGKTLHDGVQVLVPRAL